MGVNVEPSRSNMSVASRSNMSVAKMKMLIWMCDHTRFDKIRAITLLEGTCSTHGG